MTLNCCNNTVALELINVQVEEVCTTVVLCMASPYYSCTLVTTQKLDHLCNTFLNVQDIQLEKLLVHEGFVRISMEVQCSVPHSICSCSLRTRMRLKTASSRRHARGVEPGCSRSGYGGLTACKHDAAGEDDSIHGQHPHRGGDDGVPPHRCTASEQGVGCHVCQEQHQEVDEESADANSSKVPPDKERYGRCAPVAG